MDPASCFLQLLVTRQLCAGPAEEWVRRAIAGGVDLIQLREKGCTTVERIERCRSLVEIARKAGVPALMNDDPEAARQLDVAGVHLGQSDVPVREARGRLGAAAWIGVSTHSLAELDAAQAEPGVTHLGLGACFPTPTKDQARALSPEVLQAALERAKLPVFAIGGIGPKNLPFLVQLGVRRIAVSAAILGSPQPQEIAAALRSQL